MTLDSPPYVPIFPELVDNTMMSTADECEMKFFNEFCRQISPLAINPDLHAGGAFAKGIEAIRWSYYYHNNSQEKSLIHGIRALSNFWGEFEPPFKNPKTFEAMIGALEAYVIKYPLGNDPYQPVRLVDGKPALEFSFSIPTNVLHPETGDAILYGGRFDMLANFQGHTLFGVDEKTAKQLAQRINEMFDMRGQFVGYCVSPETEVLTKFGWVEIHSLTKEQEIAQWDEGKISFVRPSHIHNPYFKGSLITINGKCNLSATFDHRQIFYSIHSRKYKTLLLKDIPKNSGGLRFVSAGLRIDGFELPELFIRFLVAMQADGSWKHSANNKQHGAVFTFTKTRKAERLISILDELEIEYKYSISSKGKHTFYLPIGSELCDLTYRYIGSDKTFGDIFFSLCGETLQTFFDELRYWDGTDYGENKWMYFSTNKANVLIVQDLAPLANLHVSIHSQAGWKSKKLHYRAVITTKIQHSIHLHTWGTIDYDGLVYCVTVPSENFLIRKDRKVMVTGNCFAAQQYGYKLNHFVVRNIAILKTQYNHAEVVVHYPQWLVDRWWEMMNKKLQRLVDAWQLGHDFIYSYGTACTQWSGCAYQPMCTEPDEKSMFGDYQHRVWDPLAVDPTWPTGGPAYMKIKVEDAEEGVVEKKEDMFLS